MNIKKWFIIPKPNPDADLKLICFPYAGGSPQIFLSWINYLPDNIELVIIQAPGRGSRFLEPLHSCMSTLIRELIKIISTQLNKPYVYYGHSLGSRVLFELMKETKLLGYAQPQHFIASGSRGPNEKSMKSPIHNLPDADFVNRLTKLNGTPKEVLENEELKNILLPLLRADFKISETYHYKGSDKFNCSISVLGGIDDDISLESLKSWGNFFIKPVQVIQLPGDHFFINSYRDLVVEQVNIILTKVVMEL